MFEDYYSSPYDNVNLLDYLLSNALPAPTTTQAPTEPVYTQPTPQPVEAAPYTEPTYSQPTTQPVQTAPYYDGYQTLPTAQPVEAVPYDHPAVSYTTTPSDFYAQSYQPQTWVKGMDPSSRPGWQPDEAGMAELGEWLKSSPMSVLNRPLVTTPPQGALDYIEQQKVLGNEFIYDPTAEASRANAISPFTWAGSYKEFDPNNPTANMGQVFRFNTGNGGTAPIVYQPGQTYTLYDYGMKNALGTATTPEEIQNLIKLADERGNKGWTLGGDNVPDYAGGGFGSGGGLFSRSPVDNTMAYIIGAGLAAMGGGALLGLGAGGAGGAGAAGSVGGAGAGTAAGTAAGTVAGTTATTVGAGLGGTAGLVGPGWTVLAPSAGLSTTGAILGGSTLAGALAAASNAPGATSYADQVWGDQGGSTFDPNTGITVTAPTTTPPVVPPPIAALPEIIPPLTSVDIPPLADTTLPPTNQNSLLENFMKYYTLGSGLLDALGVGKGGSASTATTPYSSLLGPAPTFSRGQATPFTGNYETYAMGPEWNFFGGSNG